MKKFLLIVSNSDFEYEEIFKSKFSEECVSYSDQYVSLVVDGDKNYNLDVFKAGFNFHYGNGDTGNGIIYNKEARNVVVKNDLLGCFPLYYFRSDKEVIVTNHVSLLSDIVRTSCDYLGIFQFICSAYTLAERTLYKDVCQLRPGQCIKIDIAELSVCVLDIQNTWITEKEVMPTKDVIENFVSKWANETKKLSGYQLMMSAGWDSRTLMAGLSAAGINDFFAYSHGDINSRELSIANKICNSYSVNHDLVELNENLINIDLINRMLIDSDTCMFPHWRVASEFCQRNMRSGITGGIFGEIIGGHYGVLSVIPPGEQYKAMATYILNLPTKYRVSGGLRTKEFAIESLCAPAYGPMWCFNDDFNALVADDLSLAYKVQISDIINNYFESGTTDLHRIIERFQVEHRARQYINCQLSVALPVCGVQNPFSNAELVDMSVSFPIATKLHNQLNIEIISKLSPKLLDYPMAATLVPAKYPFVIQEASRVVRKIYEKGLRAAGGDSPHLGWNNFDFLIGGDFIINVIDSLRADIWDKQKMYKVYEQATSENIYPLFDMILKIKTADYRIDNVC